MLTFERLKKIYQFGKNLSPTDLHAFIKHTHSQEFGQGEIIFPEGSTNDNVYFINKGLIRIFTFNENGDEITFRIVAEGQIFANADYLFYNKASRFTFEALEDTKVHFISYEDLQAVLDRNIKLEKNRKFALLSLLKESNERVESFVLMTPEERYLSFVKKFPSINNRVKDKHLASVLGITPVSLSRIRKRISQKQND